MEKTHVIKELTYNKYLRDYNAFTLAPMFTMTVHAAKCFFHKDDAQREVKKIMERLDDNNNDRGFQIVEVYLIEEAKF